MPKKTLPRTIGSRVRTVRLALGMTQVKLAEASGIGQSALSSVETGDSQWLRGGNLLRIAAALGVSAKWLETGIGDPQPQVDGSTDEGVVLDLLRALTPPMRRAWIHAGRGMLAGQPERAPSPADPFPKAKKTTKSG